MNQDQLDNVNVRYDLACSQFGSLQHLEPPMRVFWLASVAWGLLVDKRDQPCCLIYLPSDNAIGIADKGIKGYTPTPCVICDGVNGGDAVAWFNEHILNLTPLEVMNIVLSTF